MKPMLFEDWVDFLESSEEKTIFFHTSGYRYLPSLRIMNHLTKDPYWKIALSKFVGSDEIIETRFVYDESRPTAYLMVMELRPDRDWQILETIPQKAPVYLLVGQPIALVWIPTHQIRQIETLMDQLESIATRIHKLPVRVI